MGKLNLKTYPLVKDFVRHEMDFLCLLDTNVLVIISKEGKLSKWINLNKESTTQ